MFSRVPTLIYLLLANIILLANITIPHHHHESEICIVDSHCQTDSETHKHKTDGHDHEHDGDNNSEYCVLHQVYIIPYNQVIQKYKKLEYVNYHSPSNRFQTISIDVGLLVNLPINIYSNHLLLISSRYTSTVTTSTGLRAPPVV